MNIKKNQVVILSRDIDCRKTGGPFIPKGTTAKVLIRRRDGRLWIDSFGFGQRHVYRKDVEYYNG